MTHEVGLNFGYGTICFEIRLEVYGQVPDSEGPALTMLKAMYPAAKEIDIWEIKDAPA